MYCVSKGNGVFVFGAADADGQAFYGEKGFVVNGANAHGAFFGAIQIALAVMGALCQRAPGFANDEEFALDFFCQVFSGYGKIPDCGTCASGREIRRSNPNLCG